MIGAALVVAGAAAMPLPSSASGELPGFRATALAEGGRVTFSVPGFAVVEDVIDGGGPVSQAVVDGQGSSSFASLPYPGDTALAFPGLFAAVAGQALPAGYPFFVSASHPTSPHQELKDPAGAYRLSAEAAAAAASGLAQLRGQGGEGQSSGSGGAQATSSVHVDGDTITAVAETVNEALNLGAGALRIASVRSREDHLDLDALNETFAHVEARALRHLDEEGVPPQRRRIVRTVDVRYFGEAYEISVPAATGLGHLNEVLAAAGVSIRFADPQTLVGGASAGTLEVVVAEKSPGSGVPGGRVRFRFGGASSAVTLGAALPVDSGVTPGPGVDPGPPAAPAPAPPAAASSPGVSGSSSSSPFTGAGGVPSAATAAGTGSAAAFDSSLAGSFAAPVAAAAPAVSAPELSSAPSAPAALATGATPIVAPRPIGADGFVFGSIIVAGLLMMILSSLWRAKGVLR